jgi:hypothetical protein
MDQTPLVMDEIDSGEAFIKQMNNYSPVVGACWLRPVEDGERYLYVVLRDLTDDNADLAYREVLRIANQLKDREYIDPFRVKIIGLNDPIAKAIADIYRRYPGHIPTRYNGPVFGGQAVAEVYIYPPL